MIFRRYRLLALFLLTLFGAGVCSAKESIQDPKKTSTRVQEGRDNLGKFGQGFSFELEYFPGMNGGIGYHLCIRENGDVYNRECDGSNQLAPSHIPRLAPKVIEELKRRVNEFDFIRFANSRKVCGFGFVEGPEVHLGLTTNGKKYEIKDGFGGGDAKCKNTLEKFENDVANILNIGYLVIGEQGSRISPDGLPYSAFVNIGSCRALYPRQAMMDEQSGTVRMRLDAFSDGNSISVKLLKSSGYKALDEAAVNAMRKCAVFHTQTLTVGAHLPLVTDYAFTYPE
jgi:TonB family protein